MNTIDAAKHMFMILGIDEGQNHAGFYCVKCNHFWVGPLDTLSVRSGTECSSYSAHLLHIDPTACTTDSP